MLVAATPLLLLLPAHLQHRHALLRGRLALAPVIHQGGATLGRLRVEREGSGAPLWGLRWCRIAPHAPQPARCVPRCQWQS
jgi:hypothetical protein